MMQEKQFNFAVGLFMLLGILALLLLALQVSGSELITTTIKLPCESRICQYW